MVAGQHYYIEGLTKEASGGDNLAVAWAGPGIGASPTVIDRSFMRRSDGSDVPIVINIAPVAGFTSTVSDLTVSFTDTILR